MSQLAAKTAEETVELIKQSRLTSSEELAKAFTQSGTATSGLTAYDLEAPAKTIYPLLTPLRNMIPRVSGKGGIQANWRAVVGININHMSPGLGEGNRGGVISTSTADYIAAYKGLGFDDYSTFEADFAAEGFDDVKARAVQGLLRSLMISEEAVILGGNTSLAMGTTPTPSGTAVLSGGTLADATWSVICVALGPDAYNAVVGYNNGTTGETFGAATATVPGAISRTNADGSTESYNGGSAQKSAARSVVVSGGSNLASITSITTAVNGAVGYAWFLGAAGSEKLNQVTTINSAVFTAASDSGAQLASSLAAADHSRSSLIFDGLLTQIWTSGSGAYTNTLASGTAGTGTKLTSNAAGGITEIDTAFVAFWQKYRLSPSHIFVHSQQLTDITKTVVKNGGAPLIRLNANAANPGMIAAGTRVGTVLNSITGQDVQLIVHPNIASGTIMFYSNELPYKLSGITNTCQIRARRDYYQIEWPQRSRKWEYGVYADEVLQHFFPASMGIINNIAPGVV